jgi:subtilase family serine protease
VIAWLKSEGLEVKQQARGRNWLAFSGSARQIGRALHTDFHRFATDSGDHTANATEPSVPAAIEEIVAGFSGLDDFLPESQARQAPSRSTRWA